MWRSLLLQGFVRLDRLQASGFVLPVCLSSWSRSKSAAQVPCLNAERMLGYSTAATTLSLTAVFLISQDAHLSSS